MDKYSEIKQIISNNQEIIDFAEFGEGVSEEWIEKVEKRLDIKLPESYKWWLRNYGGGEILGEEIYSIYETDFDGVPGGDIVYMHELNQKNRYVADNQLVICETDDFVFYFDLSTSIENNEYPVFELNTQTKYANDFLEFLKRRILEL